MQRRTPPPPPRPGVVLACSLAAMTMAGTIYWLPALGVALAPVLSLSAADTAAVVAVASGTSVVLVLPGLLHQAIGPARTAIVGSLALAATYAGIAQLVVQQLANPLVFLLVAAAFISLSSYCIYASAQATAVAAFPKKSRGAVNGLMSAVYAMSSGVCGALQAAFFRAPDASTVVLMLRSLALVALVPALCAAVAFPHTLGAAAAGGPAADESSGAGDDAEQAIVASREEQVARGVEASLVSVRHGYFSATAVAIVLQLCAYVDWRGNMLLFGGRMRAEAFLAVVLLGLLALFALPALSEWRGLLRSAAGEDTQAVNTAEVLLREQEATDQQLEISQHFPSEPHPLTLFELVSDRRFAFIACSMGILAGCGGVTLLNTSETLVASRLVSPAHAFRSKVAPIALASRAKITRSVRAIVVLFSAGNVSGRLFGGYVADHPLRMPQVVRDTAGTDLTADGARSGTAGLAGDRRYSIVQLDAVLLIVGMSICGVARSWWLFVGAGIVGFCYGLFYATIPALTQDLLGIQTFPRDFAVCGVGNGIISVVMAYVANSVSQHVELSSWIDIPHLGGPTVNTTKYCLGLYCSLPVYLTCAFLSLMFLILSTRFRSRIMCSDPL